MFLSRFSYTIEHVEGENIVFADILTRWTTGYRTGRLATNHVCSFLVQAEQIVPAAADIDWPSLAIIQASQNRHQPPLNSKRNDSGMIKHKSRVWIPPDDLDLKLRLLVISHCGSIGHTGMEATESILRENFIWDDMQADVTQFVRGCIHCMVSRSGKMIPRPLGHTLHGDKQNDVVHTYFLYMGNRSSGHKYVLILRDDH